MNTHDRALAICQDRQFSIFAASSPGFYQNGPLSTIALFNEYFILFSHVVLLLAYANAIDVFRVLVTTVTCV
jgi:hypothetical protein